MNVHLPALPLLSGWGLVQVRAGHLGLSPDLVVKGPAVNRCTRPSEKTFRQSPSRFSGLRWSQRMADPPLQVNTPHFTPPLKPTNGEAQADNVFGIY